MKYLEKVELTEQEHLDLTNAARALNRSARGQATFLIREFLKKFYKDRNFKTL
jgi:hypothetical protein